MIEFTPSPIGRGLGGGSQKHCLISDILILAFVVFRAFFLTFAVAGSVALLLAPAQRKLSVLSPTRGGGLSGGSGSSPVPASELW